MPLCSCRECGHQVADSARTCPSCGVKSPTADSAAIARTVNHLNPVVAWFVLLVVLSFAWHYYCLPTVGTSAGPFVVQSVNPFTNAVVISGQASSDLERLGHRLGASVAEDDLRTRARENFDVWGMLLGYSIRIES